jgi:hypothetical protein
VADSGPVSRSLRGELILPSGAALLAQGRVR